MLITDTVFLSSIEQAMRFVIVPMRERGVARAQLDIPSAEPVKGDIIFSSAPSDILKRTSSTASLRHGAWPGDTPPIRPLLDAGLFSMATLGFTLSGLEEINGVLYAQSWYCRDV
ncbi:MULTISPECIES: hypothetical protein [Pseudomonas]|uniref:hypothetical protein n=1 Tax=Pseudomonas TaxID=286 RepID=UPI00113FD10B|nr:MULTISPECIES: hypothetical protein [Pseudomonas]MDR9862549.1 hypothetical protein [Pseudomonas baetica]